MIHAISAHLLEVAPYKLRLFVAGNSPRSLRTMENLQRICTRYLDGRMDLEIVDIYQQPDLAERHQVVAAPMLIKLEPPPVCRIVGDLSDLVHVLHVLSL